MTFHQLTYVVEISKCGSINKAAHKLHLSQSGISSAVRELEEELGIQFFRRSNRGVEFTPEGQEFLSYAVSLLEQKQRIGMRLRQSGFPSPPSAIPLRKTPSCGCCRPHRRAAFAFPSRRRGWMPSLTTYMTIAQTSASFS